MRYEKKNSYFAGKLGINFILFFSYLPHACTRHANEPASDAKTTVQGALQDVALIGRWQGPCLRSALLDLAGQVIFHFSPNTFQKEILLFGTDHCDNPSISIVYSGHYLLDVSTDKSVGTIHPIRFDLTKVTVKPLSEGGLKVLRSGLLCGVSNWGDREEKDLTAQSSKLGCILDDLPSSQFDIIQVEKNILKTGSIGLRSGPTKDSDRPRRLDEVIYTRL